MNKKEENDMRMKKIENCLYEYTTQSDIDRLYTLVENIYKILKNINNKD